MADEQTPPPFIVDTSALIAWLQRGRAHQDVAMQSGPSLALSTATSEALALGEEVKTPPTLSGELPELVISAIVEKGGRTDDGDVIIGVYPVFHRLLRDIIRDLAAAYQMTPRQFEEFVAAAYEKEGWDVVILTPASGDKGRDIIATRKDFGTIRIIDQVKLYAPGRPVDADAVSALYGVLMADVGATKGVVTTTSYFAPGVYDLYKAQIPTRLTLKDGEAFQKWLASLKA
jgi:restriction system protein